MTLDSITPWDEVIDIREYTDIDFRGRYGTLTIHDPRGVYRRACDDMSEGVGIDGPSLADFAVRAYLGHLFDARDESADPRIGADYARLLPPRGWMADHRDTLPQFDVQPRATDAYEGGGRMWNPSTVEAVLDAIDATEYDSRSDYCKRAITFVADGYTDGGPLLHERVSE